MAATSEKWKKLVGNLHPTYRAGLIVVIFAMVVMLGAAIFVPNDPALVKKVVPVNESTFAIPQNVDNSNEKLAADQLAAKNSLLSQGDSIAALKEENARLREITSRPPVLDKNVETRMEKMMLDIEQMKAAQNDLSKQPLLPSPSLGKSIPPDIPLPSPFGADVRKPEEAAKIRIIGGGSDKSKKVEKIVSAPKAYLPAGTFFEAVLLNGMDAPTNPVAIKNPVPAMARIKSDAILPNLFKHDVKECFVLMAGYGSLASERAVIRLEPVMYSRRRKILEAKLDGYVVGEDGRVGMRGRLVSKQGQLIAQSLTAGVIAGFGTAITPVTTPGLNLNSGASYAFPDAKQIATSAVGKGFSDSAATVAKFYLEMASQMTPIVEVDAGRKVTLILTKGIEVK